MIEEEIWKVWSDNRINKNGHKQNTGCLFEVSNLGRIKKDGVLIDINKYLDKNGYVHFAHFLLHRAVAILFVPNPENKPCVDHINGNKLDNRACNLRWVTHKENSNNPATKYNNSKGISNYASHACWIHLGDKEKFVHEDYLDYWLDDGWIYGRVKNKK